MSHHPVDSTSPSTTALSASINRVAVDADALGTRVRARGYQQHTAGDLACRNGVRARRELSATLRSDDAKMRNALTLDGSAVPSGAVKLDFAILPEGSVVQDFSVEANDLHLCTDTCIFDRAVRVSLTVQKTQDELVVEGRVSTQATATCVRCLDEFSLALDEPFRVVANVVHDSEASADTGDEDFFLLAQSAPVLDLSDPVRELLLLAVPDNPLCKGDCAGLCGGCGRNLNHEPCTCPERSDGGPFTTLSVILNESKPRNGSEAE
jgi:uncharacterized protein